MPLRLRAGRYGCTISKLQEDSKKGAGIVRPFAMKARLIIERLSRALAPYRKYVTFWVIAVHVVSAVLAGLAHVTGISLFLVPGGAILFAIWLMLAWMPFVSHRIMEPLGLYEGSQGFDPGGPTTWGYVVTIALLIAMTAALEWFVRR